MWQFLAQDGHWHRNPCKKTLGKCCPDRYSVNQVVKAVPKDDHPRHWFHWIPVRVTMDDAVMTFMVLLIIKQRTRFLVKIKTMYKVSDLMIRYNIRVHWNVSGCYNWSIEWLAVIMQGSLDKDVYIGKDEITDIMEIKKVENKVSFHISNTIYWACRPFLLKKHDIKTSSWQCKIAVIKYVATLHILCQTILARIKIYHVNAYAD